MSRLTPVPTRADLVAVNLSTLWFGVPIKEQVSGSNTSESLAAHDDLVDLGLTHPEPPQYLSSQFFRF